MIDAETTISQLMAAAVRSLDQPERDVGSADHGAVPRSPPSRPNRRAENGGAPVQSA
jgi:hypothetical protein